MKEQTSLSYLYGANAPYIEELYESYLKDPNSVDGYWKDYFDKVAALPSSSGKDVAHRPIQESFINLAKQKSQGGTAAKGEVDFISVGALTHQIKSLDMSLKACE